MTVRETVKANKIRFGAQDLEQLFEGASTVVVAKGKRVLTFGSKGSPPRSEEFEKDVLGPSGNLRAPTLRTGDTWIVGFHADAYGERFG